MNQLRISIYTFTTFIIILSIGFLFPVANIYAEDHRLDQLYIHAYIHEDGSATISEYRHAYLTEGTENYDVIENLGESEIRNFEVIEQGVRYEYVEDWDIDASREEKVFKNSMIETDDGYEIVWGIGEYGEHEYEIRYVVTDFIKQLQDSQIVYWRFINDETNIPPQEVVIVIEAERPLTNDTEKIWGFGFEGDVNFEDGAVVAYNEKAFDQSNYATILIQFPEDEFRTNDRLDKSFADVQEEAFEGSDYGKRDDSFKKEDFLLMLVPLAILSIPVTVFIFHIRKSFKELKRLKKIRKRYEGQYNRNLPYKRNFIDVFFILQNDKIAIFDQLINAYLLKWIKEERISFLVENKDGIFTNALETLHLHRIDKVDSIEAEHERRLFKLLVEVADEEGVITKDKSWPKSIQKKFGKWKNDVSDYSRDQLLEKGFMNEKVIHEFSNDVHQYRITDEGRPIEAEIYQFINYLEDYSLIEEREPIDVTIWDNLLMWAALLNLAPMVEKQFKEIYPDYIVESAYGDGMVNTTKKYASYVNYYANYSEYSAGEVADLGGGGSTSVGGGGGSFGGGSGGGTR